MQTELQKQKFKSSKSQSKTVHSALTASVASRERTVQRWVDRTGPVL